MLIVFRVACSELGAVSCEALFVLAVVLPLIKPAGVVVDIAMLPSLYSALIAHVPVDSAAFAFAALFTGTHVVVFNIFCLAASAASLQITHVYPL